MNSAASESILTLRPRGRNGIGSIDEVTLLANRNRHVRILPPNQTIYVRGWALDRQAKALASRVVVMIDGSMEFPAVYGHERGDIAATQGKAELGFCGFEAHIPGVLEVGDHELSIFAVDASGLEYFGVASMELYVVPSLVPQLFEQSIEQFTVGGIEVVRADGDERAPRQLAGRFEIEIGSGAIISGWGFDRSIMQTFDEIIAIFDNRFSIAARTKIQREDVARVQRLPHLADCGFLVRCVLNFLDAGDHTVRVAGKRADGTLVQIGDAVTFEVTKTALPWIWALSEFYQTSPSEFETVTALTPDEADPDPDDEPELDTLCLLPGHAIFVSGWAVDRPGRGPAAAIYFSIDGDRKNVIPGRYGLPCPSLPEAASDGTWERCGFTGLIPTDELEPGKHTIEALVVSANWTGYYASRDQVEFEIYDQEADEITDRPDQSDHRPGSDRPRRPQRNERPEATRNRVA